MEVKNNHAYVTTQRILNKFIKMNSSVGCMVLVVMMSISTPTISNNIDKIEVFHLKLSIPWKNQDNTDKNILDESY